MIYFLSKVLINVHSGFNVIHYISFRAMAALLSALMFSFIGGGWFIAFSRKQFRSKAREYTPDTHQSKNDMPTMGGLFILFVVSLTTLLWCNLSQSYVWIFLITLWIYGLIGFLDDWSKIKQKKGMSARAKIFLQTGAAAFISILRHSFCQYCRINNCWCLLDWCLSWFSLVQYLPSSNFYG